MFGPFLFLLFSISVFGCFYTQELDGMDKTVCFFSIVAVYIVPLFLYDMEYGHPKYRNHLDPTSAD